MRIDRRVYGFVLLGVVTACGGGGSDTTAPPDAPLTAAIAASPNLSFAPGNVTIRRTGTVTWQFGSVQHTVTFTRTSASHAAGCTYYCDPGDTTSTGHHGGDDGGNPAYVPADIPGTINASAAREFDHAGVYTYHCAIHPTMTGTVVVQ